MIAIIGGSGFIGTRLAMKLKQSGIKFNIIDKNKSLFFPELWIKGDVRELNMMLGALQGVDVIINLAAEHKDNVLPVSLYDDVNVNGARNICLAADRLRINKIIFTSSVAVYGFAQKNTDESGALNPFNDYGRTKMEAERVYREWLSKDPARSLTIIRPTVVFGERNRGNVYNLLKQIASGKFIMIGSGNNVKSIAYVENIAAFIEYALSHESGEHLYNYIDKPDFSMNELVFHVNEKLGRSKLAKLRIPYPLGFLGGILLDFLAKISGREFPISAIRVKKFCSDSQFTSTNILNTNFKAPVSLLRGLTNTLSYEFIEQNSNDILFYTE